MPAPRSPVGHPLAEGFFQGQASPPRRICFCSEAEKQAVDTGFREEIDPGEASLLGCLQKRVSFNNRGVRITRSGALS